MRSFNNNTERVGACWVWIMDYFLESGDANIMRGSEWAGKWFVKYCFKFDGPKDSGCTRFFSVQCGWVMGCSHGCWVGGWMMGLIFHVLEEGMVRTSS